MIADNSLGNKSHPADELQLACLLKSLFLQLLDRVKEQEAQLMLTTGSTHLAVSRGQQTWYHSTCYI